MSEPRASLPCINSECNAKLLLFVPCIFYCIRREFLLLWKAKYGRNATYGNLIKICLENGLAGCASEIVKLLSGQYSYCYISYLPR